jgi:hypothetical protein
MISDNELCERLKRASNRIKLSSRGLKKIAAALTFNNDGQPDSPFIMGEQPQTLWNMPGMITRGLGQAASQVIGTVLPPLLNNIPNGLSPAVRSAASQPNNPNQTKPQPSAFAPPTAHNAGSVHQLPKMPTMQETLKRSLPNPTAAK